MLPAYVVFLFKCFNLCFIYIQVTLITTVMWTLEKFGICISKLRSIFFTVLALPLIPSVCPLLNAEKLFFLNYQYEMINYHQQQKLKHF